MRASMYLQTTALPQEDGLVHAVLGQTRREDGPDVARIGVKNTAGELRMTIYINCRSELDAVLHVLESRGLTDELLVQDNGFLAVRDDPEFDYLYSPG